jgi:hypothetical protein
MVLQPTQSRVCAGSQRLETSCGGAQVKSDIAELRKALGQRRVIGLTTELLIQPLAITPEPDWMFARDTDEEDSGDAESKLRIVEDRQ